MRGASLSPRGLRPALALCAALLGMWALAACGGGSETPDAAVDDAPTMDAPACSSDEDCDDGLACDGAERCTGGRCISGSPLECDDEIACTTDFCSEELRRCVNRPEDADHDGSASNACVDARGMPLGEDCDDTSAAIYPGAVELCDVMNVDEDCDPTTNGDRDGDGDGHVDIACCNGSSCGDDCNDAVAGASPSGTEVCNGIDDDCDGSIDERMLVTVFRDLDGDGHGDPATSMMACPDRAGYVVDGDDCDDASALRSPELLEVCDLIDNDCDGTPDPADTPVPSIWYVDDDGDRFGDPLRSVETCAPPGSGYALLGTDCDDADPLRSPAAPEECNAIDDDCNGVADFELGPGDTEDDDRDGRADARCVPRPSTPDCDDRDASSSGDSPEVCDGRDNDCDGNVDEGVTSTAYYRDEDGDGFGSERGGVVLGCGAVSGYTARSGDCDDGTPLRSPSVGEGCNGGDDDCDGRIDEAPAATQCASGEVCSAGQCRPAPPCAVGLADCDGLLSNGCETRIDSDSSNCGVCGRRCPSEPGATSSCSASRCSPIACVSGRVDCNGNLGAGRDGCEHSASCGTCGPPAAAEICGNGIDDDCDGMLEEGCMCTPGGTCMTMCGSTGTLSCAGGTSSCTAPTETCNGVDDDCDGLRDEGCCTAGAACATSCDAAGMRTGTSSCGPMGSIGSCAPPAEGCSGRFDDGDSRMAEARGPPITCGRGACARMAPACSMGRPGVCTPGTPTMETCNAIDDDCDGTVDNGFGMPVTCGTGACERTVAACGMGGMPPMCTPGMPTAETCNGIDDDCDTRTDESLGTSMCGVGACLRTQANCVAGAPVACTPGMPAGESCNGMDDDCDMMTDEALGTSTCGVGTCQRMQANCVGGMVRSCTPGMPGTETCNGMDDDCDTIVDDGLGSTMCGVGMCSRTVTNCVGGMTQMCMPGAPLMELCNSMDDDCNGTNDNTCPGSVSTMAATTGSSHGLVSFGVSNVDCPAGSAVIGVSINTGGLVERIAVRCRAITLDATPGLPETQYKVIPTGVASSPGAFGGTGGFAWGDLDCPAGMLAYGLRGRSGDDLDNFALACAPVELFRIGMTPAWAPAVDLGMATTSMPAGTMGGGPFSFDCPPGQILAGLAGGTNPFIAMGTGGIVDSIGARCAPISIFPL